MRKTNRQYSHLYGEEVPEVGQVVEVAILGSEGQLLFSFETTVKLRYLSDGESVIVLNIDNDDLPSLPLSRCRSYTYDHKKREWKSNHHLIVNRLIRINW